MAPLHDSRKAAGAGSVRGLRSAGQLLKTNRAARHEARRPCFFLIAFTAQPAAGCAFSSIGAGALPGLLSRRSGIPALGLFLDLPERKAHRSQQVERH